MRTLKQFITTLLLISMFLSLTGCQFIDDMFQADKDFNGKVIESTLTDAPADNSNSTAQVAKQPTETPTAALVQTVNLVPMYYNNALVYVDSATLDSDTVTVYVFTSIVNGQALYSTTTIPRSALTDTVSTETVVITSAPVIVEVEKEVIKEVVITTTPVVITSAPEIVEVTRIVIATPTQQRNRRLQLPQQRSLQAQRNRLQHRLIQRNQPTHQPIQSRLLIHQHRQ